MVQPPTRTKFHPDEHIDVVRIFLERNFQPIQDVLGNPHGNLEEARHDLQPMVMCSLSTVWRLAATLVGAAATALVLSDCSSSPVTSLGQEQIWGLKEAPSNYGQVGFATFPTDFADGVTDFEFWLFRKYGDPSVDVGVFAAPSDADCTPEPVVLQVDLRGVHYCQDGYEITIASRADPVQSLADRFAIGGSDQVTLAGFDLVAHQSHARIPGFGSLPISHFDEGSVTAFVKKGTGGVDSDQVSIAVGSYRGTSDDLEVLDWWFGKRSGETPSGFLASYSFDALGSDDGFPVPTATLGFALRGDWVVLVRTTEGCEFSLTEVLDLVVPIPRPQG